VSFPLPPYPEDNGAQQGEVLNFKEIQPKNPKSLDESAGPAAPGDTIPVEG
jgi:hypothetical protein